MAKQDVTVELMYSGVWNDHTGAALVRDPITITRGRSDEQQQPPPARCSLTFHTWRFNPDNVTSDLFGLIGRNTPVRVTVGTDVRFVGEVASWTPRQSLGGDNIPPDRWVQVAAAGVTRRLGQGQDPLPSVLRRHITGSLVSPVAYWALDGGRLSTAGQLTAGAGSTMAPLSGAIKFDQADLAAWLEPGVTMNANSTMRGDVTGMSTLPAATIVTHMRRADAGGSGPSVLDIRGNTSDAGNQWIITFTPGSNIVDIQLNHGGSFVFSDSTTFDALFDDDPHWVSFAAFESLGDIAWQLTVDDDLVMSAVELSQVLTGVGQVRLSYNPGSGGTPMVFGHVAVWDESLSGLLPAAFGWVGETAAFRVLRVCGENDVPFTLDGDTDESPPMGPQYPDGFLPILREAATVDGGDLLDTRTANGITYRTGRRRYNQTAVLALDYAAAQVAPPLDPAVDDQATRNDVTAKRRDGGEQRAVDTTGPLGVDAVGRYDTSVTVNTLSDGQDLAAQAGWRLHLGTIGGTRFPKITVDLDASPTLAAAAGAVDAGDLLTVANLPDELTPDLARLLTLGYTETIGSHRRRITFNCQPEEPYHIAEVEHADYSIIGSGAIQDAVSVLGEDLTETETDVSLALGGGPDWVHEADFDILVAGERMTVTAVAAAVGTFPDRTQVLTVDRSVNGVVKSHPVTPQAAVDLFHKAYIGL